MPLQREDHRKFFRIFMKRIGSVQRVKGGDFRILLLANGAGLHAVETEILKPNETGLVQSPEMDILYHFFLVLRGAFNPFCPETDTPSDAIRLAVLQTFHVIGFPFFVQCS